MELLRKTLSHDSRYPGRDLNPVPPYQLVLKGFGPCGVIFMNVCVVITVSIVMLLRDSGPYGIIFMTMFIAFRLSRHSLWGIYYFLKTFIEELNGSVSFLFLTSSGL
jgi:hypothetical protein